MKTHATKLILLIMFLSWFNVLPAQLIKYDKTLGGTNQDIFRSMTKTNDGGVIAGGTSLSDSGYEKSEDSRGQGDYWVVKFDNAGRIKWDKTVGSASPDEFADVQQTADGGYILGGYANVGISADKTEFGVGFQDYWIVKLDSNGNILWDKAIGSSSSDYFSVIKQTPDGGYLLAGYTSANKSGNKSEDSRGSDDIWVVKTDGNGNIQWDKTIGGSGSDWVSSIALTPDGGYLIGGSSNSSISGEKTENFRGGSDYWVIKLNGDGTKAWDKTFGGGSDDILYSMQATAQGGFVLAGGSISGKEYDKSEASKGDYDCWIIRIDENGNKLWDRTIGGKGYDLAYNVRQTMDGGFVLGAFSSSNISGDKTENSRNSSLDMWLVKLNGNGKKIWDKTLGGNESEYYTYVEEVKPNKFVSACTSESSKSGDKTQYSRGDYDYWLVNINYNPSSQQAAVSALNTSTLKNIEHPITIFPNPANKFVNIQLNGIADIQLIDNNGSVLKRLRIKTNARLEVTNIPAGIYFIKDMRSGVTKQFIISR